MEDWYTRGEEAFLKAYGRYDIVLEKGEGVYLYDTKGRRYLDFYAGIGVNSLGYRYPAYVEALQKQIDTLMHVSNYFYSPVAVEAAEAVKKATQLDAVFFCNHFFSSFFSWAFYRFSEVDRKSCLSKSLWTIN